jgi:hypothetical protein
VTKALHIVRKDLTYLRWLLLVWIALLVARVAAWSIGLAPSSEPTYSFLLQRSTGTIESLLLLLLAFVAARLVHGEALVGWNAFWFTRPYSRNALLVAKLLFAVAVFIVLPLVADAVIMAIYHVGPRAQLAAAASFVTSYVTWMLLALAMAALTPSLSAFVLATIASFTALSLLTMASGAVSVFLREPVDFVTVAFREFNPAPGIVATLVVDVAMIASIVYQYRQRRWRTAAAIAAAGLVASLAVPFLPFADPAAPDPGEWARNPSASPAVVVRRSQTRPVTGVDGSRKRLVYAPVRLEGLPSDYEVNSYALVDSTLTLPDGTKVNSRLRNAFGWTVPEGESGGHLERIRAAIGDVTLVRGANEVNAESWSALTALSPEQYMRLRGTSNRLDATVQLPLSRVRRRAVLPLRAGAAHDDGLSRIAVIRTERGPAGLTVTVLRWKAYSPAGNRRNPAFSVALYNESRREALTPLSRNQLPVPSGTSPSPSSGSPVLSFMGAMSGGLRHEGLSMWAEQFLFPDRVERGRDSLTIDSSWFDAALLAVLETSYAGTVTRTVTVEDFMIPAE